MEALEGRQILVTDLSELGPEEAVATLQETHLRLAGLPKERSILSLAIVRGLRMDTRVTEELKRVSRLNAPWIVATAVVGMSSIGRIIARGVALISGRSFNAFGSEAEARKWLLDSAAKVA